MAAQPQPPEDDEDPEWRTTVNLLAIIVLLVLLIAGYYLIGAMSRSRRALDCLQAGRRDCGDLTVQ